MKKISAIKNQKESKNPKQEGVKESRKKPSSEKKPAKIVLKIKPPSKDGAAHLPTKNSSSSSPSSTSSSLSVSTSITTTLSQSMDQPVARLSSSAAPPSKSRHQHHTSQQQKNLVKRTITDAPDEGTKQKKSRKNSPSGSTTSTSSSNILKITKSSKDLRENKKQHGPKIPDALNQIAPSTFPSLKNFKVTIQTTIM